MENIVTKLREAFREEAYDLVAELEAALLELKKSPRDQELIGRAFRALHTIKGSGAACEFKDISEFTHDFETLFDKVRKGQIDATKEIIALTLSARDQIKAMFDECYHGGSIDEKKTRQILASIKKQVPAINDKGDEAPSSTSREWAYTGSGDARDSEFERF